MNTEISTTWYVMENENDEFLFPFPQQISKTMEIFHGFAITNQWIMYVVFIVKYSMAWLTHFL